MHKFQVVEIFYSLQGEGFNTGRPVVFVRLAKCNLHCLWCDTNLDKYQELLQDEIIEKIEQFDCKNVVITGGEPTYNENVFELVTAFKKLDYWVAVESNATNQIPEGIFDYVSLSPKVQYKKLYQKSNMPSKADEVRIVVDGNAEDFCHFIEDKIKAHNYYLSPKYDIDGNFNMLDTITLLGRLNARSNSKKWYLSLQTHKFANIQ